jgi:hypothetical protein
MPENEHTPTPNSRGSSSNSRLVRAVGDIKNEWGQSELEVGLTFVHSKSGVACTCLVTAVNKAATVVNFLSSEFMVGIKLCELQALFNDSMAWQNCLSYGDKVLLRIPAAATKSTARDESTRSSEG